MKQTGAVLLVSIIVLIMLAGLSQMHMSTIMMNEKSTFNMLQSMKSQQFAEQGLADAIRNVMKCDLVREASVTTDEGTYTYIIDDYVKEGIYVLTSTGIVLDKFSTTQQLVFTFDSEKFNPNNGWGNGDQDAPGNSLNNNNAENNQNGKGAPKGIQKKQEKEKTNNGNNSCKQVSVEILYWIEL